MSQQTTPHEPRTSGFSRVQRIMVTLPIFIILLGILLTVSNNTRIPSQNEPRGQSFATLTSNTAVTFQSNTPLPHQNSYEITTRNLTLDVKRPATGEIQRVNMIIREPKGAGNGLPGVVFMHGAGYGTAENSFGDMASAMSSAGFVTAVIDKPVWSTNDLTRDYPGSAAAYDQAVNYVRDLPNVNSKNVGIYATSESTWISSYLIEQDHNIAFQVLLSPMVFSPRHALAFLAVQNFALAGANEGYQAIARRVFSFDLSMLGLTNVDLKTDTPAAYSIPTLVAYGSKDVMTAQVQGFKTILDEAHKANNWNVTLRSYPIANHVLRLGDEAQENTPFADDYVRDVIDWSVGTSRGLVQTSEKLAGTPLYQSIAVPLDLHARRGMTIYGLTVIALTVIMMLAATIIAIVALVRHLRYRIMHKGPALGFQYRFGGSLLLLTIITLAAALLFLGGFGEVILAIVHLAWGSAPADDAGMMYWSWPVVQIVSVIVLWAWSRVFTGMIEVAWMRGILHWPVRISALRQIMSGDEPVVATKRLGRVLFWTTTTAMLLILLNFSFWGLFLF